MIICNDFFLNISVKGFKENKGEESIYLLLTLLGHGFAKREIEIEDGVELASKKKRCFSVILVYDIYLEFP